MKKPLVLAVLLLGGCDGQESAVQPPSAEAMPPVQVVLFTHIEDNTPGGTLGT